MQGPQFRLAVITSRLQGQAHRQEREVYVAERYLDWFNFRQFEAVTGTHMARRGRKDFQGYNPNFVYCYCLAPQLTPSQIVALGLRYLDRARQIFTTSR